MADIADYYSNSNSGDWNYDAPARDVRRKCLIFNEMFVGSEADDPVCEKCFYEKEAFEY